MRPQNVDPFTFWNDYCQKNPITAVELLPNLEGLKRRRRFVDIEAALRAFLSYRAREAEPYFYELLALAMEINKRPEQDIRTALGYAADQAMKTHRARDLTRVADQLANKGMNDRAGALLDRAMEIDPGEPLAYWKSMGLAELLKDPKRMGDTVERLLSLGWPGRDDIWRLQARRQVESLAKTLRADKKEPEAQALLDRLKRAEARDLVLVLTWTGDAALDLRVEEPLGATATPLSPRTVFGGAIVKDGHGAHPEDVYVCPLGFDGDYTVTIDVLYNDPKVPARTASLVIITHEGTPEEQRTSRTIDLTAPKAVVVALKGGRRKSVLPYTAPPMVTHPQSPIAPAESPSTTTAPKPGIR